MLKVYGDKTLRQTQVFVWIKKFQKNTNMNHPIIPASSQELIKIFGT